LLEHTAYVAAPEEEVQCHPRENDEWFAIQARKEEYTRANRPTLARTTIDPKEDKPDYDSFLRINDVTKKPRKTENKYQRIDEAALISMLQECFARHPFWPIRALKEAVKQPEAYLREVLSKVAHLVRSGHFANTWKLNAAFENVVGLTDQELEKYEQELASKHNTADIAPDVAGGSDDEDDDMEDVVLD
jgi:transcription initiation factor TFIIF subunit beta